MGRRGQRLMNMVCRHCVRRAALRAASSSPSMMATASRQQAVSFALQFSKASVRPTAAISARFFSATKRVAQDEKAVEDQLTEVDESTGSANEGSVLESSPTQKQRKEEGHSVFISNMTFDATDVHLQEAFGKYGELLSVKIARDGRGLSRGYVLLLANTHLPTMFRC